MKHFLTALALVALGTTAQASDMDHGSNHGMDHETMAEQPMAMTTTLGDLALEAPYARATLPNAPVGGGFLTITNTGDTPDRLTAVETSVAGRGEIHEMVMKGDVMMMSALPDGLEIPAGETIELKPGGYHLMFMDLKEPLSEGETVTVTLTFETAGTVDLPFDIRAVNAGAGGHSHMKMD